MRKPAIRLIIVALCSLSYFVIPSAAEAREGGRNELIAFENLRGTGPNGNLTFRVEYRALISYTADEFRRLGRRHCRWSYSGNRIERTLFVQREGNTQEVREGGRGETKANPANDETADNCNNVINNVIDPTMARQASRENWAEFIRDDAPRVRELIGRPLP